MQTLVSGTWKFDRGLSAVRHSELHWLDIPERIVYKLGVMTYGCHCQHGKAPQGRRQVENRINSGVDRRRE